MIARQNRSNPRLAQTALTAAILAAFLMFMGMAAPRLAHADARSRCQHHIEHAQARLDHEIHAHGPHSPQADDGWHQLREERHHCWVAFHEWWDGHTWQRDNTWDQDPRDHGYPPGGPGR